MSRNEMTERVRKELAVLRRMFADVDRKRKPDGCVGVVACWCCGACGMSHFRILITGSRAWADKRAIARAMLHAIGDHAAHLIIEGDEFGPALLWDRITVVHGAARGADTIAARIATAWGMRVEPHPVTSSDWATCAPECKPGHRKTRADGTTYCPSAGNRRNQRMVDLGADICIAFPAGPGWSGTRDCMSRAEKADIRVVDWPAQSHQLLTALERSCNT